MQRGRTRFETATGRFWILLAALVVTAWACHRSHEGMATAAPKPAKLRLMTYNILNSGESKVKGVENRGELLRAVIAKYRPDVLGLNEANNWHHENVRLLRLYENRFDMHGILAIKHGSGVAALVRRDLPILQVLTDTERQGHGLIVLTVEAPDGKPLKVFVTHMMHTNPDTRMRELKEIVRYIDSGERVVVMGDLNSISGRDKVTLADVPENQRKRFTKGGSIHTAVLSGLEDAGLVDVYRHKNPGHGDRDHTVGTTISTDPAHAKAHLRLDYILVSQNLLDAVESIEIINDEDTNRASDHFPLVMDLKF